MNLEKDRTILEILRDTAATICFLAMAFLVVKIAIYSDSLMPQAVNTMTNLNRMVIITSGTMTNVEKATRALKLQEDQQAKYFAVLTGQVSTIADNANVTVTKLNATMDSLNAMVQHTDANVGEVTKQAGETIHDLQPALDSLNTELKTLPATTEKLNTALDGLAPIEQHAADATANTAAVTANLVSVSDDSRKLADYYYKKLTATTTKIKVVASAVSNFIARVIGSAF